MNPLATDVTYQVFNPLAPAPQTQQAPRRTDNESGRSAAHQLLSLLPSAARALFVGEIGDDLAGRYLERHPTAETTRLASNETASITLGDFDLIVVGQSTDRHDSRNRLAWLAAASSPSAQLFVCEQLSDRGIDNAFEVLMDAGWMPDLLQPKRGEAGRGMVHVIQAEKTFGARRSSAAAKPAFRVIVLSPEGQSERAAALESPGLNEVDADVRVAASGQSAADALAATLATPPSIDSDADWILLCQPHAYFPAGFGARLNELLVDIEFEQRERSLIGFIGIGVDAAKQWFAPAGFVVEGLRRESHPGSDAAVSIDELAIVVSRESLHRLDPAMGWQFWATDMCLAAICNHQVFPRIARLPLLHRLSERNFDHTAIARSATLLLEKYPDFGPIPTLNGMIDAAFAAQQVPAAAANGGALATLVRSIDNASPLAAPATIRANASIADHAGEQPVLCSICERGVDRWLPHPKVAMRSEFMKLLGAVDSDLAVYQCPHCHSTDRDRHLWHYMRGAGLLNLLPSARLLHIAPERPLEVLIEAHRPRAYVRGDLHPRCAEHLKLDVESLPFDDGSFELVICNHVLEHVAEPARALAEFHRCLVPGGVLIAQTPYAPALKKTLELNRPVSTGFARLLYGHEDHVRLFGADIVELFNEAGFAGEPMGHSLVLGDLDAKRHGCNPIEPFFAFTK